MFEGISFSLLILALVGGGFCVNPWLGILVVALSGTIIGIGYRVDKGIDQRDGTSPATWEEWNEAGQPPIHFD